MRRFVLIAVLLSMAAGPVWAADEDGFEEYGEEWAAEKAKRAHDMASSDVIYQQEDFRALYYQNQQIIALLKDLRETNRQMLKTLREKRIEDVEEPEEEIS